MSNSDDQSPQNEGWRFHAPIPQSQGEPDVPLERRESPRCSEPRYSRSLAKKLKTLTDGGVARFQVDDSCFMALKIGSELYIRPFGHGSDVRINGVPATGMTRITWDDCLQIGRRSILLRRPHRLTRSGADYSVEKLMEDPAEGPKSAADVERELQKKAGYGDASRPPEGWGE